MKILTSLLAGLFLTHAATADIIVYNQKISVTKTGGGTAAKSSTTGYLVMEATNSLFYVIEVYEARRKFSVYPPAGGDMVVNLNGAGGKESFAISYILIPSGSVLATGKNTSTTIGQGNTYSIPKSMKLTGSWVYTIGTDSFLEEYKGALVFNSSDSITANNLSLTLPETVQKFRDVLTGRGLTEE